MSTVEHYQECIDDPNAQCYCKWLREGHDIICIKMWGKDTHNAGCICVYLEQVEDRIIAMLEDPATMNAWWQMPDKNIGIYGNLAKYLIAKIRPEGENK